MSATASVPKPKRRILIVDDHPVFRDGLRYWIDRQPDMVCCGEADTLITASQAVSQHRPNLILLDLQLKDGDGLELIKSLRSAFPELRILALSQTDELLYGDRALRTGAQGYVTKEQKGEELLGAIRAVMDGEIYVSQKLAAVMLKQLWNGSTSGDATSRLSDRELQVFQMLGSGVSTREVSKRLGLSIKTIETYREHIKRKLGLKNATSLVHAATKWVEGSRQSSSEE